MSVRIEANKKENSFTIQSSKGAWEEKFEILQYYYEHYGYIRDSRGRFNDMIPRETQKWVKGQMRYYRQKYNVSGSLSQQALQRLEKFQTLGVTMISDQVRVIVKFGQNKAVGGGSVHANGTKSTCAVLQSSRPGVASARPTLMATFPDMSYRSSIGTNSNQAGDKTTVQGHANDDECPPLENFVAKHPGAFAVTKCNFRDPRTVSQPILENATSQLPQGRPYVKMDGGGQLLGSSDCARLSTQLSSPVATIDLTMNHIVPVKTEEEIPFFHHLQRLVKGLSMDDCDSLREIGINSKESLASVTDKDLMNLLPESSTKYIKAKQLYNIGLYFCKRGELKDDLEMMDVHVFNHEAQQK